MTDPRAPLTDEDLSAALDGQAAAHVLDRLPNDRRAQLRYRQLGAARHLLANEPVTPLDAASIDRLVEQAFVAAGDGDPSIDANGGVVAPIGSARSARQRSGPPLWAVAAVVAALVAVGLGLVWSGRDDGGGESASVGSGAPADNRDLGEVDGAAAGAAPGAEDDLEDGVDAAVPPADLPTPTIRVEPEVPAPIIDLGEFDDNAELRRFLANSIPTTGTVAEPDLAPSAAAIKRCGDQVAELMRGADIGSSPVRKAFVRIDGDPHLAYEFELLDPDDDATTLISVVEPIACTPAFTFVR